MTIYNSKSIGECEVSVDEVVVQNQAMTIRWSSPQLGFGKCVVIQGDGQLVTIDDEYMGRNFIKTLFCDIIDNNSALYSDK